MRLGCSVHSGCSVVGGRGPRDGWRDTATHANRGRAAAQYRGGAGAGAAVVDGHNHVDGVIAIGPSDGTCAVVVQHSATVVSTAGVAAAVAALVVAPAGAVELQL